MKKLHKLYQIFLQNPYLNAILVFNDLEYQGIFLKKDLERKLCDSHSDISQYIIKVPIDNLEKLLFNEIPNIKMKIPFINSEGELFGALLYDEFVSEFFPEDFQTKLSLNEIFQFYEHPILILNQFQTILYINQASKDLLSEQIFGCKISEALLAFEIGMHNNQMTITRQNEIWYLLISKSCTPYANYYIYQLIMK